MNATGMVDLKPYYTTMVNVTSTSAPATAPAPAPLTPYSTARGVLRAQGAPAPAPAPAERRAPALLAGKGLKARDAGKGCNWFDDDRVSNIVVILSTRSTAAYTCIVILSTRSTVLSAAYTCITCRMMAVYAFVVPNQSWKEAVDEHR
jgi:hypothetical protein